MRRIATAAIHGLDALFVPEGLPVVEKSPGAVPTTTVLVSGGAGVGKTTLALGIAVDLAGELGGRVLWMSTESSSAEVPFRLEQIGRADLSVAPWSERAREPGALVLTWHVALEPAAGGALEQGDTATAALVALRETVLREQDAGIRAVVLDALPPGGEGGSLRGDVARLLLVLEDRGISTVIVAEGGGERPEWLSSVVDLSLRILRPEPRRDAGRRQLVVYKSRFSTVAAGPHDYGDWPRVEGAVEAQLPVRAPPIRGVKSGSRAAQAVEVLRAAGRPMHISELAEALGVAPGLLASTLDRAVKRGVCTYGLPGWSSG